MALDTIYGVNGVGKDTVAAELGREKRLNITITSASRMCMYLLGFVDNFDATSQVGGDAYQKLEQVPQEDMVALENGPYKELVDEIAKGGDRTLMLSHLVFALHLGDEVEYLTDRQVPAWYIGSNSSLIQLHASPEEILSRRQLDLSRGLRKRPSQLRQIIEHQALCDIEWDRIAHGSLQPTNGMHTIENHDLHEAVSWTREVLYE